MSTNPMQHVSQPIRNFINNNNNNNTINTYTIIMALQMRERESESDDDDDLLFFGGAIWFLYFRRQRRVERSLWCREWLLKRNDLGAYDTLLAELKEDDQKSFLNFLRMSPGLFDGLVEKVTPLIQKEDTVFRKSIPPGLRLAITLRYLATGM